MQILFACILAAYSLTTPLALHAQPDIPSALQAVPIDWKAFEIDIPKQQKQELIDAAFRDEELRLVQRSPAIEANAHIVDIDIDGRADLVYYGSNGSDILRLVIFRSSESGLVRAGALWGALIAVERSSPIAPLSFTLVDYPCCAGYTLYHTVYTLVHRADTAHYELTSSTAFTSTTLFPAQLAQLALPAIVMRETDVRATPDVSALQPERLLGSLPNPGNLLGFYPEGSYCAVLADTTNGANEHWLFVRFARNKPAKQDLVHKGQNTQPHFGIFGWVRAADVRTIAP